MGFLSWAEKISPQLAAIEQEMHHGQDYCYIGAVAVRHEFSQFELGLNKAKQAGDAQRNKEQQADKVVYCHPLHGFPTACK